MSATHTIIDSPLGGGLTVVAEDVALTGVYFEGHLLSEIPYGQTRSYGDLACELGDPALAQAVGAANGRNPLSVLVPCHRVVGADSSLTGYAGGLERKRFLLELEEHADAKAARLF